MLEDIAILTGGSAIAEELSLQLENVALKDLLDPGLRRDDESSKTLARKGLLRPSIPWSSSRVSSAART